MAISIGLASLLVAVGSMAAYVVVRQIKLWYVMSHFKRGVPARAYPLIGHAYMFDRDPRCFSSG
ncbi:hypothetical protein HOLleu_37848 [Holothuria leucospilota]|uniref:Uncharacterized protein n=1 Tax=Holothuria leucospilota TaxID=206669 RepID=A0A9Q0YK23_HOLLE|nr:hypothetical protein HOLleu_37848 [Holothuria leucospilota]